ncbi:hypothetical protein ZWY2020_009783 [Hordeum vulgare]|nr:hypothetical protein ZWY2020_009783 [Hordeum vulgare]
MRCSSPSSCAALALRTLAVPTSDASSLDQGVAYLLIILALVLTYLIHPLDASSPYKLFSRTGSAYRGGATRRGTSNAKSATRWAFLVYSPNYILPSTKCCSDEMGMDLSWVEQIDPHDSHFLAIAIAEQQLMNAEFDDCMTSNSSGATCCRSIALILMVLLLIRHVIVIVRDINMLQDATMLFSAILQFAGFFLPCYVIARSCYAFQHRRRRQGVVYKRNISFVTSLFLVITTQVLRYGWAGLMRKYVVERAHMWWPVSLVQVSLMRRRRQSLSDGQAGAMDGVVAAGRKSLGDGGRGGRWRGRGLGFGAGREPRTMGARGVCGEEAARWPVSERRGGNGGSTGELQSG